jgi:hypothetical protein
MHPVQYAALAVLFTVLAVTGGFLYLRRHRPAVGTVTVNLGLDTSQFEEAMRRAATALDNMKINIGTAMLPTIARFAADLEQSMRRIQHVMAGVPPWALDPKLREVHVAGLEAKMYVRAGMDHEVATPEALDRLIRQISHQAHLTPAERAQVIAAAYRGWVTHRDGPVPETLAYHTLIGDTAIEFAR